MGLVFAVVTVFLLDGVIGEVPEDVRRISAVLLAAGAQVALLVPVGPQSPSHACHKGKAANVKLSAPVQQGLDVLLNQGTLALLVELAHCLLDASLPCLHRYSHTSVSVFSRLNDPSALLYCLRQVARSALDVVGQRNDVRLLD